MVSFIIAGDVSFYFETRGRRGHDDGIAHVDEFTRAYAHLSEALLSMTPFAIRAVWYDDKHGDYRWFVDVASVGIATNKLVRDGKRMLPGGDEWHEFEFRQVSATELTPTERLKNETGMTLLNGWPPN